MSDDKEKRGEDDPPGPKKGQVPKVKPKLDSKGSFNLGTSEKRNKSLRRSRSNDAEHESRRGRHQDRTQGVSRPRGRSEEGRRQPYDQEPRNHKAEPPKDDLGDTECIVCFCSFDNVFKAPKLLTCGHTFCLECLARINVTSPEITTLPCPICRKPTEIKHGRDLPHLGNNENIFCKLPPEMQRALSVRFQRSKGKLVLKKPPRNGLFKTTVNLPVFKKKEKEVNSDQLGVMEEGLGPATMINVGRPSSRISRVRRFMYSNECYYAIVAAIVAVTLALILVGIFTFVFMPIRPLRPSAPNQTVTNSPP